MPEKPVNERFWHCFEEQFLSAAHSMSMSDDESAESEGRFYKAVAPSLRRHLQAEQQRGVPPEIAISGAIEACANICAIFATLFTNKADPREALKTCAAFVAKTIETFPDNSNIRVDVDNERNGDQHEQSTTA